MPLSSAQVGLVVSDVTHERDRLRVGLEDLLGAARPYVDRAAPHEQLFDGEDLRNFEALGRAVAVAEAALTQKGLA